MSNDQLTNKVSTCVLIDGTEKQFPVAILHIDTPYFVGEVEAKVMEHPVYDLILGNIPGVRYKPDPAWRVNPYEIGASTTTRVQGFSCIQYNKVHSPVGKKWYSNYRSTGSKGHYLCDCHYSYMYNYGH